MARSVADVAMLFDALAGDGPVASSSRASATSLVFGVPRTYFCDKLEPGMRAGAREGPARRFVPPVTRFATWKSLTPRGRRTSTCTSSFRKRRGITRGFSIAYAALYSPGVRIRLEMGRYLLAEDYVRALDCASA